MKSKLGRGSDFVAAFPVRVAEEVAAITNTGETIAGVEVLEGKSYLLLDDVTENTFILGETLRRYGIRTTMRQNGIEALAHIKESPAEFDGVITDLRMPLMSGQSFIQEIRRFERQSLSQRRVPIIVMTAEASVEEKRLCLAQYGADEYLLKPVKLRDLISVLVRIHGAGSPRGMIAKRRQKRRAVLIVDDDAIGSRFMVSTLTKAGHKCAQAFSVAEGERKLAEGEYSVVLLDNLLGDGTGADFVRQAGKLLREREVKVISVSGNDVGEQRRMYEEVYKVDGYLQKPVKRQDVVEMVQII